MKNKAKGRGEQLPLDKLRFEVTVHPGRAKKRTGWQMEVNIDRVPDANGRVRGLARIEDCIKLLEQGFEVRLHRADVIKPLDKKLIESDESFERWLEDELQQIKGYSGGASLRSDKT